MTSWRNDPVKYAFKKRQGAEWAKANITRVRLLAHRRRLRASYIRIAKQCLRELGEVPKLPKLGSTGITVVSQAAHEQTSETPDNSIT